MRARRLIPAMALFLACAGTLASPRAQTVQPVTSVSAPNAPVVVFGPEPFTRTRGPADTFERSFTVPPWIDAPFTMYLQNGEPDGPNRLSLAVVWLNGSAIVAPWDLKPRGWDTRASDGTFSRTVTLKAQNTLHVALTGPPDRYATISITGTSRDRTAPDLTFAEPSATVTDSAAVRVRLRYTDAIGSGDPAASGIAPSTLRVTVDGTDRTASFAASGTEALATLELGDGVHVVEARVQDLAGNESAASSTFTVDTVAPVVMILEPAPGASTTSSDIIVAGTVDDQTLQSVIVNGVAAALQDAGVSSSLAFVATVPLTVGDNRIVVVATDAAGHSGAAAVDVTRVPPCDVSVSPSSATVAADGATGVLLVSNLTDCVWAASSNAPWITLNGAPDGYAGQVVIDGATGYWRLDELGTTAVRDSSGHAADGTLIDVHTQGVAGATADGNAATHFDSGYVQFQRGVALPDGAFTIEAWLRYDEAGWGTVVSGSMWRLSLDNGGLTFFAGCCERTVTDVRTERPLNDGAWHHVVATFDPGNHTTTLYVDGVLDASGPIYENMPAGDSLWMIGWLTATVDDVAIYPSALSPAQVATHFELRQSTGGGSGGVMYSVAPNPSIVPRTGVVTVAGRSVSIAQAGQHCFSVTPPAVGIGAAGGAGTIQVAALDPGCAWTAASSAPWVSLDLRAGSGAADVHYTVAGNSTPLERTATLTIAGRAVTVTQSGEPVLRPGFRFSVAAGAQHSLALTDAGLVWSWGANGARQLGDGTTTNRLTPVRVPTPANVVAIAAGASHSLALRADGTVWAWGANARGQLGDGTIAIRTAPVQASGLTDVVAIAAGSEHSMALKADGTVWVWGRNNVGQLGDGTGTSRSAPKLVAGLTSPAIAIAASGTRTLVVDVHGSLWAFGVGTFAPAHVPLAMPVTTVAAAAFGWFAVTPDGAVWAWGTNDRSQLGDGTTISPTEPLQLSAIDPVLQMGTGASHVVALFGDGTVQAWGGNETSQLGDGTTPCPAGDAACAATQYSATRIVVSLLNVVAVSANGQHSLAVTGDGSVWSWGAGSAGQLGDGTTLTRPTPQQVLSVPPSAP